MIPCLFTLGQGQTSSGGGVAHVLLVLAGLLVVVGVGALVAFKLRRGLLGGAEPAESEPLTLHGLRQLHAQGVMTDDEFEKAKRALLGAAVGRSARPEHGGAGPAEPFE